MVQKPILPLKKLRLMELHGKAPEGLTEDKYCIVVYHCVFWKFLELKFLIKSCYTLKNTFGKIPLPLVKKLRYKLKKSLILQTCFGEILFPFICIKFAFLK